MIGKRKTIRRWRKQKLFWVALFRFIVPSIVWLGTHLWWDPVSRKESSVGHAMKLKQEGSSHHWWATPYLNDRNAVTVYCIYPGRKRFKVQKEHWHLTGISTVQFDPFLKVIFESQVTKETAEVEGFDHLAVSTAVDHNLIQRDRERFLVV